MKRESKTGEKKANEDKNGAEKTKENRKQKRTKASVGRIQSFNYIEHDSRIESTVVESRSKM